MTTRPRTGVWCTGSLSVLTIFAALAKNASLSSGGVLKVVEVSGNRMTDDTRGCAPCRALVRNCFSIDSRRVPQKAHQTFFDTRDF